MNSEALPSNTSKFQIGKTTVYVVPLEESSLDFNADALDAKYVKAIELLMREEDQNSKGSV